jgi:VCBS repeat
MADTSGTSGDDIINGSTRSDKLIGGAGNDTLDGGTGSDFLNAGGGDDTIVYDEADYKILGGGGFDTLWFTGQQQKLDLRNNKIINGIEKLWLDGGGGHSVWFTAADIVRLSDNDQMIITGDAGNRIYPGSGWSFAGLTSDGSSQILTNSGATLIVSLPVYVEGFSNNASLAVNGVTSLTEDSPLEASVLMASGTLTVTDLNAGQALLLDNAGSLFTPVGSTKGTLTVTLDDSASGSGSTFQSYNYVYQINNADVQYLGAGTTLEEIFTVKTIDGSILDLKFVTTGVNDPALFGAPTNTVVTEDLNGGDTTVLQAIGKITVTDVDEGEGTVKTTFTSAQDNLGTLALQSDGSYIYSVSNNAVKYLGANLSKEDSFDIFSADGTPNTLRFTINGINNPAVIGTPTDNSVTVNTDVVDGYLQATGSISITDPDANEEKFTAGIFTGQFGTLNLLENGDYTYSVLNNDVQNFESGQTENDSFTIYSADGTSKDITFEIIGSNESAVIGTPTVNSLTQDTDPINGKITLVGSIPVTDKDPGESGFQTTVTSATSNIGELVLETNGSFSYTIANEDLSGISQNSDTFTIASLDGTSKVISFTINNKSDTSYFYTSTAPQTSAGQIIFGLDRSDLFSCSGVDQQIYGNGGADEFAIGDVRNSMIQGGDGDDEFLIDSMASNNKIYGDNGNDTFHFYGIPSQDIWGGLGSDTYQIFVSKLDNSSLVVHDFDFSSPTAGGDRIVFTGPETDFNPNTMNLALTQSSTATDHYLLTADEGAGRYTILTLIGTKLTMSDLADNIPG